MHTQKIKNRLTVMAISVALLLLFAPTVNAQVTNPQSGSAGLTGTVPTDPPSTAATITFPTNGQVFQDVPIEVTGLCTAGLTVKLFKNEVFGGSALCENNGTYSITLDLFSGTNELIARIFDDLDQPGPDSNAVTVTYDDADGVTGVIDRVTITSNYAKRGANPGSTLTWPFIITGGTGPYAISIDWGDGTEDLFTRNGAGEFIADHIYEAAGTYKVIVKVTDSNDSSSFLQVIGVANGPILSRVNIDEDGSGSAVRTITRTEYILWPLYVMLAFLISTFWFGRRYELKRIREKLRSGQPFKF